MGKVSIGLRGWRFSESDVFGSDGRFKPFDEMPEDVASRISRLTALVNAPCHACYLVHGAGHFGACNVAEVVYGEPMDEVVLCADHETDFLYWYREAGGERLRGDPALADAFHEWFDGGGRAPEGYEGMEHVDTDPEHLPEPPTQRDLEAASDVDLRTEYPTG